MQNMQFNVPCVYDHLAKKHIVYTVRAYVYKTPFANVDGIGTVRRTKIGEVHKASDLHKFELKSGFNSLDDWWGTIKQFTKAKKKYLYKVEVVYD